MRASNSLTFRAAASFVLLAAVVGMLLLVFAAKNSFDISFPNLVLKTEYVEKDGKIILQEQGLSTPKNSQVPKETNFLRFILNSEILKAKADEFSLLLSPMENALRIRVNGAIVQEFGSFSKSVAPRLREFVFNFSDYDYTKEISIEMRISSLAGRDLEFFRSSGLAESKKVAYLSFFRAFANYYGYLGLSAVFMTVFLFLLIVGINSGLMSSSAPQALAFLAQSWISLYFSRFYFELPDYMWFYRISFVIYVLGFAFFLLYLASEVPSGLYKQFLKYLSASGFVMAFFLFVVSLNAEFLKLVEFYKSCLLILAGQSVASFITMSLYFLVNPSRDRTRDYGLIAATGIIMAGYLLDVSRSFGHSFFMYNIGPYSYLTGFLLLLAVFVNRINGQYQIALSQERDVAVARTTQMLAHDVRKPFSMLQLIVEMIHEAKTLTDIKEVTLRSLPELERAMGTVNGLIQDVMEISSQSQPQLEDSHVETLLTSVLFEAFQLLPQSNIEISYLLKHDTQILSQPTKLARVFSNILNNAIQAMNFEGHIWIKTRNVIGPSALLMVEFTIGNTGSYINKQDLPYLFDAFFTKGKKGGTGLGLAIAKKIINDHGGSISCTSQRDRNTPSGSVSFVFTIPASKLLAKPNANGLPTFSKDVRDTFVKITNHPNMQQEVGIQIEDECSFEIELVSLLKQRQKIRILILDDESVYRNALQVQLQKFTQLTPFIEVTAATKSSEALEHLNCGSKFDLIIIDVDLGPQSLSGFECVETIRSLGHTCFICVHSNRILANDNKTAIQVGANAFLPKPLSKGHMLKLLIQACETPPLSKIEFPFQKDSSGETKKVEVVEQLLPNAFFVFVSQNETAIQEWQKNWPNIGQLRIFRTPESFFAWQLENPRLFDQTEAIFCDLDFGDSSDWDGPSFSLEIHKKFSTPCFLVGSSITMELGLIHLSNSDVSGRHPSVPSPFDLMSILH